MARIPYLDPEDLDPRDRELLHRPANLYRALANSPEALRKFSDLGYWIRHSCEFDPRLREMAILQVGYLTRSPYEWSHHLEISRDYGVRDEDVNWIIAETEGRPSELPPIEQAVLRATRELTEDSRISDGTWMALAEAYPAARLVDLVLIISCYSQVVRILAGLQIDVEPDYQKYLEQFPLPGVPGGGGTRRSGDST